MTPEMYEKMVIDLANKNGLYSLRPEVIEQWFSLIKFFEDYPQPPCNILLWYIAGKEHSVEQLTAAGLGDSLTVKFEKEHIDNTRMLMRSFH